MGSSDKAEPTRYIIGIGVSRYDDSTLDLEAVPGDVTEMVTWFKDKCGLPHVPVLPSLLDSPTNEQIRKELRDWLVQRGPDDVVVIYIAAHGDVEFEISYVQGRDSPRTSLAGGAVDGDTLGNMIGQAKPHNVLVIVDTCVAGALGGAVLQSAERQATRAKSREAHRRWSQAVVCSTYGRNPAFDGLFAKAFVKVVSSEQWTGTADRWVSINRLMDGLNTELGNLGVPQVADRKVWGPGSEELIPNPNYATRRLGTLIDDVDLNVHFEPSSRGVGQGEAGWYFTGRVHELRAIVSWLNRAPAGSDDRLFVITGPPGCGKSALLARVIALSDPRRRAEVQSHSPKLAPDTIPSENSIDAVLWCRNRTLDQLIVDLGRRLGSNASTMEGVLAALALSSPRRWTLAIDALDEAVQGHGAVIAARLIRPLVDAGVRIMIATRPRPIRTATGESAQDLLKALGLRPGAPNCLWLDKATSQSADMREYVTARLTAASEPGKATPYQQQPELTGRVSERIATAAGTSFLVAAVTARALANRAEAIDPSATTFAFPTEAGAALARYIEQLPEPWLAFDILRPLAWAEGLGLPWGTLWAPVATALAGVGGNGTTRVYDDQAVRAVLEFAGDLIVEARAYGEPVYRLFHEALAEHLREGLNPTAAHDAIANAIALQLRNASYEQASPYTLAHLGAHLAQGSGTGSPLLYELATDPAWERAHRQRLGDSSAFLRDVNAAIMQAERSTPPDLVRLTGACSVHSGLMAVAPALVLDVVARAGRPQRAEQIANNLTFAVERAWAYALIAPSYARERDVESALRCLGEAQRATAAINPTHVTMAWAWIAEAAVACDAQPMAVGISARMLPIVNEFVDRAVHDSKQDTWDLSNVILWAGLAARTAGDATTLEALRRQVLERFENGGLLLRNQDLQAASVVGATAVLLKALEVATTNSTSIVRDGNIALALAHAGMTTELHQLFAFLDREGHGPRGEPNSLKRFAWALAIDGRFDAALQLLEAIDDEEERARGLRRIVTTAAQAKAEQRVFDAAREIAVKLADSNDARVKTFAVPILFDTGDRDRALSLAEELIAAGQVTTGDKSLAFGKLDRVRRPLETNVRELSDEKAMLEASRLAQSGHHDQATVALEAIRVPRYRWEALFWIAARAPKDEARKYWVEAMREARLTYGPAVQLTAGYLAEWLEDGGQRETLLNEVKRVGKRWQEARFVEQYESLRTTLQPGPRRTRRLTRLMDTVRDGPGFGRLPSSSVIAGTPVAAAHASSARFFVPPDGDAASKGPGGEIRESDLYWWTPAEVTALVHSGSAGQRVFALALMQRSPQLRRFDLVLELIQQSQSAFEQFHALLVMRASIASLSPEQRKWLRAALKHERTRHITPGTDRAALARQIEEETSERPRKRVARKRPHDAKPGDSKDGSGLDKAGHE